MKKAAPYHRTDQNNLRIAFWSLRAKTDRKISIKEITELAGYNRGTFYLYYNDVYDLLDQIEEEILRKITDVLNDSLEKNDTFDLSGQMGILLDLMQTYETYAAVLLSDHGDPHFATRLKEVVWHLLNRYFVPSEDMTITRWHFLADFYLSVFSPVSFAGCRTLK